MGELKKIESMKFTSCWLVDRWEREEEGHEK